MRKKENYTILKNRILSLLESVSMRGKSLTDSEGEELRALLRSIRDRLPYEKD